jgi:hypothetical protein
MILNVRFCFPPTNEAYQGDDGHTHQRANPTPHAQEKIRDTALDPTLGRNWAGQVSDHQ